MYREGLLISGDLDTLIQHCLPTDTYEPCSNYLFTFLLCGRLFIPTGHLLLRRLLDDIERLRGDRHKTLGLLLSHWVQKCPYDFLNAALWHLLERECLVSITGPLRESILRELRMRLDRVRLYQNYLSLLRQVTVANERLMESSSGGGGSSSSSSSCAVTGDEVVVDGAQSQHTGDNSNRSSAGSSAIGGGGCISNENHHNNHQQALNGIDNLSCESPYVNVEEMAVLLMDHHQHNHENDTWRYEEFHLNGLCANNANRRNLQRIAELKGAVRGYQSSLADMTTAAQVAHQLTHIEVERLAFIGPEEFVQAFVKQQREKATTEGVEVEQQQQHQGVINKGSNAKGTPSKEAVRRESATTTTTTGEENGGRKLTQNLENYVQWFNRLTYLVASDIVKVSGGQK